MNLNTNINKSESKFNEFEDQFNISEFNLMNLKININKSESTFNEFKDQ